MSRQWWWWRGRQIEAQERLAFSFSLSANTSTATSHRRGGGNPAGLNAAETSQEETQRGSTRLIFHSSIS